ncbi:MAG: hypothetical protein NT031_11720 [Planctomycetota bacterium]|nr:hypothetical protein [Planctomycetota bacterium]
MNDPRGSIWRQWDLHCHTPASFDYQDMSISNQAIVNNLLGAGITAVAICDHHTMDVARITEVKRLAGSQLTVFPGIELRSELGGGEVVHYIGIFSDDANVADLWTRLQGTLKLTATDITAMGGDERVYVPFRKGATLIKELGGVVTVHAGKKSNSIERIANAEEFKQAVKEDMARHFIDILEIGQANDATGYKTIVFPGIGFHC